LRRNCILEHDVKGNVNGKIRGAKRRRRPYGKEKKEKALDCPIWTSRKTGHGPVARQAMDQSQDRPWTSRKTGHGPVARQAMDQSQDRPRIYTAQYRCQNNLAEYYRG